MTALAPVRTGVALVHGHVRAVGPTPALRARFRALELGRSAARGGRRPPVVRVRRVRGMAVGHLDRRPASSTSAHHAVVGSSLGYAWGACEGRGTRRGTGSAVLAHRPRGAWRVRVSR